jgi:hypothetical protein
VQAVVRELVVFAPPRGCELVTNPDGHPAGALDCRSAMALHKPVPAEDALLRWTSDSVVVASPQRTVEFPDG